MNTKNTIIAIMITFCLTATLFMIIPIRSANNPYDPWIDYNDDGKISLADLVALANSYGTTGTPINKTALLLLLQTTMDTLNATITDLQNKNAELENRVAVLERIHYLPDTWFNGLVGYWKFDEGNGTTAGDSSGNNNNGTLENGPTWVSGKYGNALSFDGIDDVDYVSNSGSLQFAQSITVECWVRVEGATGDNQVILSCMNGYVMEFQPDGTTPQFVVLATGRSDAVSSVKVQIGDWAHLVGTYDGNYVRIYVNGSLTGEIPLSGNITAIDKPITIGYFNPPSDANWLKGTIDNIMVYNRSLSADEVLLHYRLQSP